MANQDHFWSLAARSYETEFIDPYRPDVTNPLPRALKRLAARDKVAADLGCGIGPLLPRLAELFGHVHAIDFAEGMLKRAREKAADAANITFHQRSFADLAPLHGQIDVAVAVNSLVLPDISLLDQSLAEIRRCLRPGGVFLGILPAMDGVIYQLMLLVDRAIAAGKPIEAARKNAAHFAELEDYDCAFGDFKYQGLHQHFWQPFEVGYRLKRAGFTMRKLKKVELSWKQFPCWRDLKDEPPPWDWFFLATI